MSSDPLLPGTPFDDEEKLTSCAWCGGMLGQSALPKRTAHVFCSRRCEIEANYWLFQEMCVIEITNPSQSTGDHCDSP
jgi:endogenous inhibitor of DNA gyrase (YacG/DUF329 family)